MVACDREGRRSSPRATPGATPEISPNVATSRLVRVFVILDDRSSPDHPLAMPSRRSSAARTPQRFVEDVRGDEPELASYLRIEEPGARDGHPEVSQGLYPRCIRSRRTLSERKAAAPFTVLPARWRPGG